MSRALSVRAVLALVVVGVSGWLVADRPPNLGLDLRGGTQIVLETRDGDLAKATSKTTDEALEVLRRRVDQLGVSEPSLTRSGEKRIIVELPGVQDPAEAVAVVGRTAQLTFHPVLGIGADPNAAPSPTPSASPGASPAASASAAASPGASASAGAAPSGSPSATAPPTTGQNGELTLSDEDGAEWLRLGPAVIDGSLVEDAQAGTGQFAGWQIDVEFRGRGPDAWQKLTGEAACAPMTDPKRRVAIVLDGKIISSPQVVQEIGCNVGMTGGRTSITGQFSGGEAKDLALLIRAGGLPVPVQVIEQRTVGPTLGADAIEASARAAVLGLAATILFIIAVYRLVGGLAAVALVAYGLISYAALLALDATLTLPGLAGFVLAIGMAVDANVLVFERAREEYAAGKRTMRQAIDVGFDKAWSAILDSNVTTLLAAGLLFFLASGPVRGFGVTLSIGVIASMFTALVLSRVLVTWALRRRFVSKRPGITGLGGIGRVRAWLEEKDPDIMGRRRLLLTISAVAVVVAILGIGLRGLNWGVEFTGGRLVEYSAAGVSVDEARAAVAGTGLDRAVVNASGDGNISVRSGGFDDAAEQKVRAALAAGSDGGVQRLRDEQIGPSLGDELRNKALIALGVALAAQLTYLAFRFRWQWAAASVVAMLHDVVIVVGFFAWLGKPIDGVFLAAILTVIGYSVNDSVVVFDRIRELVRGARKEAFATLANRGSLQTVPRTVNTGLGAIFVLIALAVLGRDSLVDFALALLVGVLVGTYSSVFFATPLAIVFESRPGGLVPTLDARVRAAARARSPKNAPKRVRTRS
ncbi:protein translocase subunit SecDF [Virgisporangium aliadipatigenens]|uniref:Multifunctional fusion protein n=1 Tax=Virgisporangium aliadipatigenens TaxID=741659 RepID=A0A8J4DRN4_9ACTN|nr:protein translocase subunit SecD [Virgisporangium aliadipatigenens]GIJ46963.1 protein translocase subunit SecDF [Virgisporangium aliadipatigenens]